MHKKCLTQTSPTVSPSPPLSASHSPQSTIAMQYTHARTQTYRVASPNRYVTRQGKQTRWLVEKHRTINFSKRNERKDPENGIIKKQRLIHCNLAASCHVSLRFAGVRGASGLSLSLRLSFSLARSLFLGHNLLSFLCVVVAAAFAGFWSQTLSLSFSSPLSLSPIAHLILWAVVYFWVLKHFR